MGKIEAVLFDMDGVLTDSEEFIAEAGVKMFAEKGYNVAPEDFIPFRGYGENRFLGGVAEKYGIPFELERDKARTYEIYVDMVRGRLQPLPGSIAFVRRCRELGLKTALATSTDYIKMMANLEGIGLGDNDFETLVNGLDVERRKPYPDIYLLAAKRIGVDPARCLVVEDAVVGVEAGKAAGARVLALTTSFSREELTGADWIAATLAEAPEEALQW